MNTPAPRQAFTARIDGEDRVMPTPAHQTLLDSLEASGVDWPSSCREGTCGSCMGRLKQGRVRYDTPWLLLSDQDVEDGLVLPCIAYPESDLVLEGSSF